MTEQDVSLQFLTQFISTFDGNTNNLHTFIKNCDYAYKLASKAQKDIIFKYIQTKVTGKADLITSCRNLRTWEEYKSFLEENFADSKSFPQLLLELQTCKQNRNESVLNFTQRIERCYSNLMRATKAETVDVTELIGKNSMIKQMALQAFLMGALPQYSIILRARNPKTFEEASIFAINEEKMLNFTEQSNSNQKFCSICKKSGHISINCFHNKDKRVNQVKSFSNFTSKNSQYKNNNSANSHRNITITCFFCQKRGHYKKDCWKYKNLLEKKASENFQDPSFPTETKKVNVLQVEY